MQKQSIDDRNLLHFTGFMRLDLKGAEPKQVVDLKKLAAFCGVSVRTVRGWASTGLPQRARTQLENLYSGSYLPPAWRDAGITVQHDGVQLRCGTHIALDALAFWQFIVCGVDWSRVKQIEEAVNMRRKTGRLPAVLVQNGVETMQRIATELVGTAQLDGNIGKISR